MSDRISGRVLSVTEDFAGDSLAADAASSDTVLFLDDATYFDPAGGTLHIEDETNEEEVVYLTTDLDEDTVTLATGLVNAYDAETPVTLYPRLRLRYAQVQPTGSDEDTLTVTVPSQVALVLPLGSRNDDSREQCVIELDRESSSWVMRDVYVTGNLADIITELLA